MFELHNQVRHYNLPVYHWQELREQAEEFRRARQLKEDSRSGVSFSRPSVAQSAACACPGGPLDNVHEGRRQLASHLAS